MEDAEIERAKRKPTESVSAYDHYLQALAVVNRMSRESNDEALRLFSKAIERDPEFALAYARAAHCYVRRKANGWMVDRAQETADAERLARRAVELGRDDAVALSYSGHTLGYVVGDLDDGAAFIERALILNSNLAAAWGASGWMKVCFGEPDTAVKHVALAMRLSPLDPRLFVWQFNTALAHLCAGRYDDATIWAEKALRDQPTYPSAMRIAAASHALAGRIAEAQKLVERLRQLDPLLRISKFGDIMPPYRRPEDRARYLEGLRRAGLPE
jgi:tetratricopeptide (TPR) repeat protein